MDSIDYLLVMLENSYNLDYWKRLDKQTQQSILEQIHDGKYPYPALQVMITNYEGKVAPPDFKYVFGTQTIHSCKLDDKTIYLFGDLHVSYNAEDITCPASPSANLPDYLSKVFSTTQVPIDFFVESYLVKPYGDRKLSKDIQKIRQLVGECVGKDKKACQYPAVRSHYVDLRQMPDYPYLGSSAVDIQGYDPKMLLVYLKHNAAKSLRIRIDTDKIKKSVENVQLPYKKYITRLFEQQISFMNEKTTKGEPSINTKYNTIMSYINKGEYTISEVNLFKALPQMYSNILNLANLEDKKTYSLIQSFCYSVYVFFMATIGGKFNDVYTLARMCRTFKQIPYKISIPPKNIIVFAGRAHTENLLNLLIGIGANKIVEYKSDRDTSGKGENDVNCLKGLPRPLFSL